MQPQEEGETFSADTVLVTYVLLLPLRKSEAQKYFYSYLLMAVPISSSDHVKKDNPSGAVF